MPNIVLILRKWLMLIELKQFSGLLHLIGVFSELHFTWHFLDSTFLRSIDSGQCEHRSPYCMKLKRESSKTKLRRCIHEHQEKEFRQALRKRVPFLAHCHAGAMELAVPIFIRESFIGVLCAGTFRDPVTAGYQDCEDEWKKLPVISEKKLLELGDLLLSLSEHYLGKVELPRTNPVLLPPVMSRDTRILKAVVFLRRNQGRKISAVEIAREAGMSLSHFQHHFHDETGFSFSEFLQRMRVESACKLMECSDLPLSEIAGMCGIQSPSRLGVLFKRYLNQSPRLYRLESLNKYPLSE